MGKRLSVFNYSNIVSVKYLVIIICFFICGAVVGVTSASSVTISAAELAIKSLSTPASFPVLFFELSKYHLLSVCFGMMLFGVVLLPVVAALRGFLLSFTSSCFITYFGSRLFSLPFFIFASVQLISVVILFFLMNSAMAMSVTLTSSVFSSRNSLKSFFVIRFLKPVVVSFAVLFIISFLLFLFSSGINA